MYNLDLQKREENQQLWAEGSYLSIIRTLVQAKMKTRRPWNVWLSLNPESDSSAIWLERKFDVPKSGRWASESIFEIPLFPDLDASHDTQKAKVNGKGKEKSKVKEDLSTGLIVFECTPTDHVEDELEKYVYLHSSSRSFLTHFSPGNIVSSTTALDCGISSRRSLPNVTTYLRYSC
jgi:hypothetical protein